MVSMYKIRLKLVNRTAQQARYGYPYRKIAPVELLNRRHADNVLFVLGHIRKRWCDNQHVMSKLPKRFAKPFDRVCHPTRVGRVRVGHHYNVHGVSRLVRPQISIVLSASPNNLSCPASD